jgi:hypothetical protein
MEEISFKNRFKVEKKDSIIPAIIPLNYTPFIKAFINNSYPEINSEQQLAKEIMVPESRVQICFQI